MREAADWLCVSRSTLKRMIAQGLLPTIRIGRRRKIPANALSAYVARDLTFPDEVVDTTENVDAGI
jgi:excisionase family DNA binding protein